MGVRGPDRPGSRARRFWTTGCGYRLEPEAGQAHGPGCRYHFESAPADNRIIDPVSAPVEIEVLPPSSEAWPAKAEGQWGEPSERRPAAGRPVKTRIAADEYPVFDLDVKADAGGARNGVARGTGQGAGVEVDGLLYQFSDIELKKLASHVLKPGEQVDGWTTGHLERRDDPAHQGGARRLALKLTPGKHTIRIQLLLLPGSPGREDGRAVQCPGRDRGVAGTPKEPAAAWGEPSEGVRLRARAASPTVRGRRTADHRPGREGGRRGAGRLARPAVDSELARR